MTIKINGNVNLEKKKKKTVKEELSDLEINIDKKGKNVLVLHFNKILKPYQRNRLSGRGNNLYDPLNSYKAFIQRKLIKLLMENNISIIDENHMIFIDTIINITPPENFSLLKKLYCLRKEIRPVTKPDNDNYEKTIFDIMNEVVWKDDNHVVCNTANKYYSYNDETIVTIKYEKIKNVSGRLSNEIKSKMSKKEKEYLFGKDGE